MSFAAALNVRNIDYAQVIGGADDTEESGTIMGLLKGIYHKLLSHKMWIFNVDEMYIFTSSLTASKFENDKLYLSRTTTSSISVAGLPAQIYIANRVYKCSKTNNTVTGFEEIVLDSNILINNILTNQKYIYDGANLLCITIGREYNSKGEIFNDYNHNIASSDYSHAEGNYTTASGYGSHSEGYSCKAQGYYTHAEGNSTTASSDASHSEGYSTIASGQYSHSEGRATKASGTSAHAEGWSTSNSTYYASGDYSHIEGYNTTATREAAHAEGNTTLASGLYSHSAGDHTIANSNCMTTLGRYNTNDGTAYNTVNRLFVVGNGTANNPNARSDAFEVYSSGEVKINSTASGSTPKLTIGSSLGIIGTTASSNSQNQNDNIIATKYYVDNVVSGGVGVNNKYICDGTITLCYMSGTLQTVDMQAYMTIEKTNSYYILNAYAYNQNSQITINGELGISNISFTVKGENTSHNASILTGELYPTGSYVLKWPSNTFFGYLFPNINAIGYETSFAKAGESSGGYLSINVNCNQYQFFMELHNLLISSVYPSL